MGLLAHVMLCMFLYLFAWTKPLYRACNHAKTFKLDLLWYEINDTKFFLFTTRECSAFWGKPERVTEVCCRLSSTVENGALSLGVGTQ